MNCKRLLLLIVFVLAHIIVVAQDFSNKGTDFWVGYSSHVSMYSTAGTPVATGGTQNLVLYFTSDQVANVKVEIPATGWVRTYTVTPNTISESVAIPKTGTDDARLALEGVSNKGIHITSDQPIVAYAHNYDGSVSGASLLFPTNTLGQEYYVLGFTQTSNANFSYPFCFVIATEDNTVVEVTPSANTLNHAAGVTFTQTLQKGQILNLLGQLTGGRGGDLTGVDLTGTRIRSISSGNSGCKRVAVFCGSGKLNIKCLGTTASADNTVQQCFPSSAWGKKYITIPTKDMPTNFFRVMVNDPATVVKLNGTVLNGLIGGRYYQFQDSITNIVEADKPVMVAQFITTTSECGNNTIGGNGDPEMIYLSPIEQTINKITLNSTSHAAINSKYHYINIVMKTTGVSSFNFDGSNITNNFRQVSNDPSYSYAQINTKAGIHNLQSDSGFNAIAYGYGSAESYGYNAGTNVKDLYQFVALQNQYATVSESATCTNTPFFFSITLPYKATSLSWNFNSNPNLSPNTIVTDNNPTPDTSYTKDGKNLNVYSIKSIYSFNATGTYPIKVTANNQTSDGCSGIQEINYDVVVNDPPSVDFSYTQTGCATDTTFFLDASSGLGRKIIKWQWDFGDGTTDSVQNPIKKFATPNSYNVKLVAYTELGCLNTVTKPIAITAKPLANFGVSLPTCAGSAVTFSDSSTIISGTISKWIWNFGNGNTVTNTDNRSVTQTYAQAGSYPVSLQVETITGCKSLVFTKNISVNALPATDFSFSATCLPDSTHFTNLSTVNDGTLLSYIWDFGDNTSSVVKNPSHQFKSTGPFNVKLTATSTNGCVAEKLVTINNINAQPKANFSVVSQICSGDTLIFTDQSNGSGNTIIKWRWDFADGTFDTTRNPKHVYTTAKTYNVQLTAITDKSCVSDTAVKTITINPKPAASFITSAPTCETKAITVSDKSNSAGNITSWNWDFGDQTNAAYTNGNPFTKTYNTTGTYNIKLSITTDQGCKNDTIKAVTIYPQPQPNFILPKVCLSDAFATFLDSSYIADGTESSFTYLWNFGDANANIANPNTSTAKDGKHKFSAVGIYQVTLTVQSKNGCTASITKSFTVNGAVPLANFNVLNSNNLCSNTTVQIQNTSTVDFGSVTKLEIIWDFIGAPTQIVLDDNPSPNKIYNHLFPTSQTTQTYQVKVRAYSGGSCVNEKTSTITVNATPKVSFATIPGICLDASPRQITQATENGGVAGSGAFSGLGVDATGIFNPSATGAGTFPIKFIYTSNAGCRDSAAQTITVWKSPQANWNFSSPICETSGGSFIDSSIANFSKITEWNWNFGDNTIDNRKSGSTFTKAFAKAGTYNVSLQVKTDSGCVSPPLSKSLIVNPSPVVDFSLPAVCLGTNAQFNDLSTIADSTQNQFTYLWNFGDPNDVTTSTLKSPLHKYSSGGPFTVKLTVTSTNGCNSTLSKQLTTIYNLPQAGFTVAPPAACLGSTFIFTDTSRGISGNITNWSWSLGDGTTSVSQNTSRNYTNAGIYKAALIVTNDKGCVSLPFTINVDVQPYPTVDAGPDLVVLEGGSLVLNPIVTGTGLSYRWTPSTYLNNDLIKNPTTSPSADITYKITVTSGAGCSASDQVFVKLLKEPSVPNVFSPNNDGINDTWNIDYLNSYPGATIEIFNRNGQMVYRSVGYNKPWDGKVNGNPLPVGVYYYIINPKNGRKQITGSVTILR